jgi:hypothetical protein
MHLHAMNDFSRDPDGTYTRSHTYTAECYLEAEGKPCPHKGKCLIAEVPKKPRRKSDG